MRPLYKFFFERIDPIVCVPGRVIIGLSMFLYYLSEWNEFNLLYSQGGVQTFIFHRHIATLALSYFFYGLLLTSAVGFTLGLYTRLSAFLLVASFQYFRILGNQFMWGWTNIVSAFIILLVLGGCQRYFSLDSLRTSTNKQNTHNVSIWPIRLIQIYVCCIYISVGYHRINDPTWLTGDMLLFALDSDILTRFPNIDFHFLHPILIYLCWAALLIELVAPIFLWIKKISPLTILLLMLMHGLLELTTTTGRWQVMLIGLLFTFIPPKSIHTMARIASDKFNGKFVGKTQLRFRHS